MSPSILLVSLDTLRADVALSGRFPTLRRLGREGTTFTRCFAAAPFTPASHGTILTGLGPARHGIRHLARERLSAAATPIAEVLASSGWRTGAVVSCPGLHRWYGLDRGFEHYDDRLPPLPDGREALTVVDVKERGLAARRAEEVVACAVSWLDRVGNEPFFLFAHFFDAHWPYAPPASAPPAANPYEGEVGYMDLHLGRLLDEVDRRRAPSELLVVVLSDHGEDLAGWYPDDHGHLHPEESGHGSLLYDVTTRVPLWMRGAGVPVGVEIPFQVRLADVAPTLYELTGRLSPEADGRSLVPMLVGREASHRPAASETFFREELRPPRPALQSVRLDDRWKVIWERNGDHLEVLDLLSNPTERTSEPGPPPPPPETLSEDVERVVARLAHVPALASGMRRAAEAVLARPGVGLAVKGSTASGTVDAWSDLDLEVALPAGAGSADHAWARQVASSVGRIVCWFPADHIGLADLLIFFIDLDGAVVKLDLNLAGTGGGMVIRTASGGPPAPGSRPDTGRWTNEGLCRRFCGWSWYTWTKLARGEVVEAVDALACMRGRALLPLLQRLRGLPEEGCRRLEVRLARPDLDRLHATHPSGVDASEVRRALGDAVEWFSELTVAANVPGTADLEWMWTRIVELERG